MDDDGADDDGEEDEEDVDDCDDTEDDEDEEDVGEPMLTGQNAFPGQGAFEVGRNLIV